ncbi:MAG: hypothetical protein ACJA2P_001876 [Rhodoferax sp.]|jgi:hypothetical protein
MTLFMDSDMVKRLGAVPRSQSTVMNALVGRR